MLALIPLFYQLIEAYHPQAYTSPTINFVETSPNPTVLGTVTTPTPTAIPANVGGEGQMVTIGILGDSMIQTLGQSLPDLKKSLSQYFPHTAFNLINYGTGSQTIEYGLNNELPQLISQNPDIIVIESFAYNNFGNSEDGFNRHWLALGAITSQIKQKLPHTKIIIAATIAPNSVVFGNGIKDLHFSALEKVEKASTIKLYLQNTINFANSQGYYLADTYHYSLVGNDGSRDFISSADNLHPSATGAQLFSDTLASTISQNKLLD